MRPFLLPLLALAGCGHHPNMTLEPAQQPVVAASERVVTLAAIGPALAAGEAERLAGFLAGAAPGRGDRILTDAPAGPARDLIARAVGEHGMLLSAERPAGSPAPGGWRVVVSHATVTVPGCPDWTQSQVPQPAGAASRNFGCATNATLAAMLDDPMDLVRGRSTQGAVDPRISVRAIKVWREAVPTGKASLERAIAQEAATGGGK